MGDDWSFDKGGGCSGFVSFLLLSESGLGRGWFLLWELPALFVWRTDGTRSVRSTLGLTWEEGAMGDVIFLKRMYRRLAAMESRDTLALQKTWLEGQFLSVATEAAGGGFQATATGFEGGTLSGIYAGSTAEERSKALDLAIEEITKEIAAETDRTGGSVLLPRVCGVPR
jgi:hypothetical protein